MSWTAALTPANWRPTTSRHATASRAQRPLNVQQPTEAYQPGVQPFQPQVGPTRPRPQDMDMQNLVIQKRQKEHPDTDGWFGDVAARRVQ